MIFNRMALLAVIGAVAIPSGRGNGGRALLVSAFSSGTRVFARSNSLTPRNAPVAFRTSSVASNNLGLAMSSVAVDTEKLEASLEVTHPAFEVVEKDVVSEYGSYCVLYRHKQTGAELLSVANDDDNKVFGITFRTPPEDSTGVPHILEHSVLCGSKKYKTKDPFVRLLQGSLNTFLNAFTYPDRTCYVVASQNKKDFYNLINVYADAVFNPRAVNDPMVHAQEGWHLELEKKEDPLIFKGVVYNEMKGVYSSPDSLLNRESTRSIFPATTYGVDSGGDPVKIPDLSFEQFRDFHGKFYHPANSRIYFSGDDDVLTRLEIMDEYLQEFGPSPESKPASEIMWQEKNFAEPLREQHPYPVSEDQPGLHMINVNWLVNDKELTPLEELTLSIADHLLMGTSSSTLYKALAESGLGAQVTGGGLMDELLQATFSVGLKGVAPEKVQEVENLIIETLTKVVKEGFVEDDIASSLNTIEFQLREFNTGNFPKGLAWMLGAMSQWIYNKSPTDGLKFEKPLAELKAHIESSGSKIFQDAIEKYLLENNHRSVIEMVPSKTLEKEQLEEEEERLAATKASMTDEELEGIIQKTAELKKLQAAEDTPEDIATIPALKIEDLTKEQAEYPIEVINDASGSGVTVVKHEMSSTSGIAYVDFGVDLSQIPLSELPLIGLFSRLMKENGAGSFSDVGMSRHIGTYTGGVDVVMSQSNVIPEGSDGTTVSNGDHMITKLFFKGKAVTDQVDKLFDIYKLLLTEGKLDSQKKAIEFLKEAQSRLESGIPGSGHAFANMRIRSRYSPSAYIEEQMQGISYLETVKTMLKQAEEDWPTLLNRLNNIRDIILDSSLCRDGFIVNLTGDKEVLEKTKPSLESFLESLPGDTESNQKLPNFYVEDHPWVIQAREVMSGSQDECEAIIDEGFVVPTQVSYVGKGGRLFEPGEEVNGSSHVAARYLKTGYLWDHVRVIGGAYGGFSVFSPGDGIFSYLSYRDPNLGKTLEVYDNAGDALLKAAEVMTDEELTKAIVGAISDLDSALGPDQKGWVSFQRWLKNESAERRQKFRDEVLSTSKEDFIAFANRLKAMNDKASVAVISSKAAFEGAKNEGSCEGIVLKEVV